MGVDANVNEETIDQYLGIEGVAYRDVRMLDEVANWEAIGGDSMLSGYIEGFEVVPLPYLIDTGDVRIHWHLPEAVGEGYTGPTLFRRGDDGEIEPVYYESMDILEDLFPPDEDIVLFCGAGGYAGMTRDLLISLGWDENRIWNVGGWWYYEGSHGVDVARDNGHGQTTWDFHKVPYHEIDFDALHEVGTEGDASGAQVAEIADGLSRIMSQAELDEVVSGEGDVVVYVYLPGCAACAQFSGVVSELAQSGAVPTYAMSYRDLGDAGLRVKVGHTPGVIVFHDGDVVSSLSADRDEDMPAYRSLADLTEWLGKSIDVPRLSGEATADIACADGCEP